MPTLAMRAAASAAVALLLAIPGTPGRAQSPLTLKSVRVDLPSGDRMFPGGEEATAINNNCLACHSAGMVLTQPALSKAAWNAEVRKMIEVYKAPVAADDVPAIVAYLVSTKGSD